MHLGMDYMKSPQNKQGDVSTHGEIFRAPTPQSSDVVKAGGLAMSLVYYYIIAGSLLNDNTTWFSLAIQGILAFREGFSSKNVHYYAVFQLVEQAAYVISF